MGPNPANQQTKRRKTPQGHDAPRAVLKVAMRHDAPGKDDQPSEDWNKKDIPDPVGEQVGEPETEETQAEGE